MPRRSLFASLGRAANYMMNSSSGLLCRQMQIASLNFDTDHDKKLASLALTHRSASHDQNNVELAKVGETASKAAVVEALYRSRGTHPAATYGHLVSDNFSVAHLAKCARDFDLHRFIVVSNGTDQISDSMSATALLALLGVVKLTKGQDDLLKALKAFKIVDLPAVDESK